jgi:hypothetical protein
MGIKGVLTRVLMNWLRADDQARVVADFIAWVYADLPPAGQQEKIEWLGPKLIEWKPRPRVNWPSWHPAVTNDLFCSRADGLMSTLIRQPHAGRAGERP